MNRSDIRDAVRRRYAQAARNSSSCCGVESESCSDGLGEIYAPGELEGMPDGAVRASLGCANPVALADLRPGETVLDLGSGGGIDVLLSARRVGPSGKAYGLDMTEEMLDLARRNQREAGVENAEFLEGTIEEIPLPPESVDVVISNCVINLSTDKQRVLREAYRVIRSGGRLAIADIVHRGPIPEELKAREDLWTGCLAGALEEDEYRRVLAEAGFEDIELELVRFLGAGDAEYERAALHVLGPDRTGFVSALVRARKP